jgi:hypothetical protein
LTRDAHHALDSHITGVTLWATLLPGAGEELQAIAANLLRQLAIDEHHTSRGTSSITSPVSAQTTRARLRWGSR